MVRPAYPKGPPKTALSVLPPHRLIQKDCAARISPLGSLPSLSLTRKALGCTMGKGRQPSRQPSDASTTNVIIKMNKMCIVGRCFEIFINFLTGLICFYLKGFRVSLFKDKHSGVATVKFLLQTKKNISQKFFTSDSDHLLHTHTAVQPAENVRTL